MAKNKEQGTRYKEHILYARTWQFMSKELEDRFQNYAKTVRDYCARIKWDVIN